jgi:hypothetical protein
VFVGTCKPKKVVHRYHHRRYAKSIATSTRTGRSLSQR